MVYHSTVSQEKPTCAIVVLMGDNTYGANAHALSARDNLDLAAENLRSILKSHTSADLPQVEKPVCCPYY